MFLHTILSFELYCFFNTHNKLQGPFPQFYGKGRHNFAFIDPPKNTETKNVYVNVFVLTMCTYVHTHMYVWMYVAWYIFTLECQSTILNQEAHRREHIHVWEVDRTRNLHMSVGMCYHRISIFTI